MAIIQVQEPRNLWSNASIFQSRAQGKWFTKGSKWYWRPIILYDVLELFKCGAGTGGNLGLKPQEKAGRIYALQMDKSIIKEAEKVHSYEFRVGYAEAIDDFKNVLFHFIETILTKMVQRGVLDDLHKRNLEKLTKSPAFLDVFTSRALTFTHFLYPVAKFSCAKTE